MTRRMLPVFRAARVTAHAALLTTTLLASSVSAAAAGSDAKECARAAEHAQSLRSHGKLLDAMAELPACLRASCPAFVRDDCAQSQNDITASVPTVVVSAKSSDGRDLVVVRVTVDGAPFVDKLDGLAKPLDPGERRFHFETDGAPPMDQTVVLREGEKRRAIEVTLALPTRTPEARAARSDSTSSRGASPLAWVLGGAGIVGAVGFGYFGATGLADYHALRDGCGRVGSCAESDVSAARTKLWLADAFLAASVISFGFATWLFVRGASDAPTAASLVVRPTVSGGVAELRASF